MKRLHAIEQFAVKHAGSSLVGREVTKSDRPELTAAQIVVSGGRIAVYAGPLHPGTYKFFDDYHPDTATGTITAEAK